MMTIPPYHSDLNPTKLIFQHLHQQLLADQVYFKSLDAETFLNAIEIEMNNVNLQDVIYFVRKRGYYH